MSSPIFGIEHILSLESPKIESIAYSVGSDPNEIRVFAALKGGRLYEYFIQAESRNERHRKRSYTVTNTISTVASKKKITKLLPIHSVSKVFVLSNGNVSAFDYTNLAPVFCDISVSNILDMGMNLVSDPSIPFIWILIKKRIILYQYMQGQFIQFSEIALNDTPSMVSWLEDDVVVQFKDRIQCINIHTSQTIAEIKTQVKNVNQMTMKLLQTRSLLMASSPSTYSCLVKDDTGVHFKDWSIPLPPTIKRVCYASPFIYVLSDSLQVYDEYSGALIETVSIPSPLQTLCDADFTYPELKEEIYSMVMGVTNEGSLAIVDLEDSDAYVMELLDTSRVMPAFAVLHRNEKIKNTMINQEECHRKAFLFFFTQANFAEAFHHALISNIHPNEFLPLFPDLVLPGLPAPTILTKDVIGRNNQTITDFIISVLKQQSYNPSSITAGCEEVVKAYEQSRQELLKYLQKWHARKLVTAVDTAILRLLLQYHPDQIESFLSAPTACEEEHIQPLLMEKGLYSALAQFYVQKQEPEKALNIWKQLAEGTFTEQDVDGILLISKYLRNATDASTLHLIQEFSPFVFAHSVDEAYKIFTLSEVSTDPIYEFILEMLDTLPEEKRAFYRTRYIKYLIMMTHIEVPALNTEYIQILLRDLEEKAAELNVSFDVAKLEDIPEGIKDKRMELFTLLSTNTFYDPEVVLETIGDKPLWFERVTLLTKLGRFKEAIYMTINDLRSVKYACECCLKFATLAKDQEDPWKILLEHLLQEENEEKRQAFREAALRILETYASKIDPIMVLSILPDDISNADLVNYYQVIIPHSTNCMREARIHVGMKQVFLNDLNDKRDTVKNGFAMIDGMQKCMVCGEFFTNDDCIAITKERHMVHDKCLAEEEKERLIELKDMFYHCL